MRSAGLIFLGAKLLVVVATLEPGKEVRNWFWLMRGAFVSSDFEITDLEMSRLRSWSLCIVVQTLLEIFV